MKTRFFTVTGLLLLIGLMAAGCAQPQPNPYPKHANPRPFYNDTWWGSDPVCSPSCPTGLSGKW